MNLADIKERASKESNSSLVNDYLNVIYTAIEKHPNGVDIDCPRNLVDLIETVCDNSNVPCHIVAENYISVAKTYTQLYIHESTR